MFKIYGHKCHNVLNGNATLLTYEELYLQKTFKRATKKTIKYY